MQGVVAGATGAVERGCSAWLLGASAGDGLKKVKNRLGSILF